MDFGKLLHVAKQNTAESNVRCYSTKFSPPKKESKDKTLSSGIKRFLAKREEEEREKERKIRENRERLEAMRDNKSKNKINKMLKVIKSANKSVVSDSGSPQSSLPQEPDSDDFGYESQESSALYKRLMEKFKTSEEDPKTKSHSNSTPSPSKSAKRPPPTSVSVGKGSSSNGKSSTSKSNPPSGNKGGGESSKPQPTAISKPRRPPPPVVNFEQLLKLAEQKQFEPIKVDVAAKSQALKSDRPMSAKEKREHEERLRMAEARRKRMEDDNYDYRKAADPPTTAGPSKANGSKRPDPPPSSAIKKNGPGIRPVSSTITSSASANNIRPQNQSAKPNPSGNKPTSSKPQPNPVPEKTRQFPPPDVQKTRAFPPQDVQRGPANSSRPFPPADVRRRPPERPNPYSSRGDFKRPRVEEDEDRGYDDYDDDEDEDEYDSEMDDFIDDGPLGQEDISSCIKEIFGYDKSRYRDEDFDDRDMESSFAQQMREESYSRKVGRLEDEADMRQEALEKARKAALKRAAKRR